MSDTGGAPGAGRLPDRASIAREQSAALQRMLEEILPGNRFYARKLAGYVPLGRGGIASLPFTSKQELVDDQRESPPYGTNLTYPLDRYTRFSQTSGTTATPLRWLDTPESWSWMVDRWTEVLLASGVEPADRIFFAFSFGPFLGFWTAFEAGTRLGCLCLPGGGMTSAARLRAILENEATVVCCTPTYAVRLDEAAAEEGFDLSCGAVRIIVVGGEPGAAVPATRSLIERSWPGAALKDHHGMTEMGPVTYECPVRPGVLHVMESGYIPEVIDPNTLSAVSPGEEGELVLTNLGRLASPLIRYRTGDVVRRAVADVCACGRAELALVGGILGRTDDMLLIRGVNVYPSAVEGVVRTFAGVAEYRVEIDRRRALPEVHLLLEPVPGWDDPEDLCRQIERALRDAFNLRVPVSRVAAGTLPRSEMKADRWVRRDGQSGRSEAAG